MNSKKIFPAIMVIFLFSTTVYATLFELNHSNGGLIDIATCPESGWDCVNQPYTYADNPTQSLMFVSSNSPLAKGNSKIYVKFNLSLIPEDYNMIVRSDLSLDYGEQWGIDEKNIGCWEYYEDSWQSFDNHRKTNATWSMARNDVLQDYGVGKTFFDVTYAVRSQFAGDKIISFGLGNYSSGSWAFGYRTHIDDPSKSFRLNVLAVRCGDGNIEYGETCENCKKDYFSDSLYLKTVLEFSNGNPNLSLYSKSLDCNYSGEAKYFIKNNGNEFLNMNETAFIDIGDWAKMKGIDLPFSRDKISFIFMFESPFGTKKLEGSYQILCNYQGTNSIYRCPSTCPNDFESCWYEIKSSCGSSSGIITSGKNLPSLFCKEGGSIRIVGYEGDLKFKEVFDGTTTTTLQQITTTSVTQTTTVQKTATTTISQNVCILWFRGTCLRWNFPSITTTTATTHQTTTTTIQQKECLWWFRAKCLKWVDE